MPSPYTFLAADALVGARGRCTLIAAASTPGSYREIPGHPDYLRTGAGWRRSSDLVAALSGVALVTSDAHAGLVAAIGSTCPQRRWGAHYAANLMAATRSPPGRGCAPCYTPTSGA